jgi:hypothetical protein
MQDGPHTKRQTAIINTRNHSGSFASFRCRCSLFALKAAPTTPSAPLSSTPIVQPSGQSYLPIRLLPWRVMGRGRPVRLEFTAR